MKFFDEITPENANDYRRITISLDTAATLRSIQDLVSTDKLIRNEAYRCWGTNKDGEELEKFNEPFFITPEGRAQFYNYRKIVCRMIRRGKIEEFVQRIAKQNKQETKNNK